MIGLRPTLPEEAPAMRELFRECYGRDFPLDRWRWQYQGAPDGPAAADAAWDGSRMIGHLASVPLIVERGPDSIRAALLVDLIIHPRYRGLELFCSLTEAHIRSCAAAGRELLIAFPNDRSYPLLKRLLDFSVIEELDAWEAPREGLAAAAPAGWTFQPPDHIGAEFDSFWARLRPDACALRRDARRLEWRYRSQPAPGCAFWAARDPQGRLRGWLAAKVFAGPQGVIGDILDLLAEPGPAEAGLLARALEHFRSHEARTISAWAPQESPAAGRWKALGLEPRGPRTHFVGRWTAPGDRRPFPGRGRDWFISKGDSDVF